MSGATVVKKDVARLANLTAYTTPKPPGDIDLWLAGNEGRPPEPALLEELSKAGTDAACRYPNTAELTQQIADRFGLCPEQVLVTAGADDALMRCCLASLEPGRELILPIPTFEMLPRYARIAGGAIRAVEWSDAFPIDEVCEAVGPQTGAVALVTPNNPTGAVISLGAIQRVASAAQDALVIVDLAYVEFADEDPTADVLSLPNVVVTRTMSKAWGLAGLRVGYALGRAEWIERLRAVGNPYAVAGPSLCLASAALQQDRGAYLQQIRQERGQLESLVDGLGLRATPSQGNFVLLRSDQAESIWRGLAARGIAVRWFGDRPGLTDALRITCPGDDEKMQRLSTTLREVLTQVRTKEEGSR